MNGRLVSLLCLAVVFCVGVLGLGVYAAARYLSGPRSGVRTAGLESDPQALAKHAGEILRANCRRCHGQDGAMEGGFNYVTDRQRLVDRRKIAPGHPDRSPLLSRILDHEMPPPDEKSRPSEEDVAVLRRWIEIGAPEFGAATQERKPTALAGLPRLLRDDLAGRPERDRRFIRYFTFTHLYNMGLAEDELQTYRQALAELVNSLSWGREVILPQAIDAERTVFRIDLRDYKWEGTTWDRVVADFPYGCATDDTIGRDLAASAGCRLPHVRGDWFTAVASRPPLYYELLQIPATDRELEALLRVDAAKDIRGERVVRAGFNNSGVSRNNRVIERHESAYGAYWKSYDFGSGTGAKNIFANPLGPDGGPNSFQADGGEMLFDLPNGLHGYLLVDGGGRRVDQGPTSIVSDPKRPDRAVVAGLSCMSCHSRGLNDKGDQVREHVRKNPGAFPQAETNSILALYAPRDRFEGLLRGDTDRYRRALEKTGTRWGVSDPIETLASRFEADVDLKVAAAEVGVPAEQLGHAIAGSPELGRALGAIRADGGAAPRRVFAEAFADLMRALRLGEPLRPGGVAAAQATALKARTEVDLPEGFSDVTTGGGGRYIIFHLKKAKKLAVCDVLQAKIVREIELSADDVRIAAGRDKLMVVLPGEKVIQRWDLRTFQKEKTAPVPTGMTVATARMGYDSPGPLALWGGGAVAFFDPEAMAPVAIDGGGLGGSAKWGFNLRVSPNGQVFVGWLNNLWPSDMTVLRLSGRKARTQTIDPNSQNERWMMPNADGSNMIVGPEKLLDANLQRYSTDHLKGTVLLATADPRYFLAAHNKGVSICTSGDRRVVFPVTDKAAEGMDRSSVPFRWFLIDRNEPRIRFLPEGKVLVFLDMSDKKVIVRPFDLFDELAQAGKDYLLVLSQPKTRAKAGAGYRYQMEVKSKAPGVSYTLENGPKGMTISTGGELRWEVPRTEAGKSTPVIVTVKNTAGKELVHSFDLTAE